MRVTYPIDAVGQHGIVIDVKPHELAPNAWSDGRNVRARNGFIEKCLGEASKMGTPPFAPYGIMPVVNSASAYYWIAAGLEDVSAWDGASWTEITKSGATYGATADKNWTMTNFQGLPILNNGVDHPQVWTPVSLLQLLTDLANWNANWRCASMRAFKQFLVAFDVTKSGTRYPRMVKWSHPAAIGNVPSSWDETDATKDAGEYELAETGGDVLDGVMLRDAMVIYKEDAVFGMQYVGGTKIMRFGRISDAPGILAKRCAVEFMLGNHVALGTDDIYRHDGQSKVSIVEAKLRKWWFARISSSHYRKSFVVVNPAYNEVWICSPLDGATFPSHAIVWNWVDNTTTIRELNGVSAMALGVVTDTAADAWNNDSGTWDADGQAWSESIYNPTSRRLFQARPSAVKIALADETNQFTASNMTAYIERVGLGIPFEKKGPPDIQSKKLVTAIYPRIEGTVGGVVQVYVGSSDKPGETPTYNDPVPFTIGTTEFIPTRRNGKLIAIKFLSNTDVEWRLSGYDIECSRVGRF